MQVTHHADHVTHAMIGGHKTIEFGISSDASFMHVLSATLYSDQRLAVAREVLCNAWDAHIRAGLTETPIQVTITNEKIVVRDFATGIAFDMMGPLYGTYGGTDKANNGKETGGFGLGCKAPFAYTDHFEVTSWHQGTRTIYNISKSSAEKMGKPGITPIVSLPTDQSGLQVIIPLKDRFDCNKFIELFNLVAHNGEMNVELNGEKVKTLPLSKSSSNWLFTSEPVYIGKDYKVFVRYGNVIYPVPYHEAYQNYLEDILSFLNRLNGHIERFVLVLQAQPDTISVTPSRESLSLHEHTIATLKKLLIDFHREGLEQQIEVFGHVLVKENLGELAASGDLGSIMQNTPRIPGKPQVLMTNTNEDKNLFTVSALAKRFLVRNYPKSKEFYYQDLAMRIESAIQLGVHEKGQLRDIQRSLALPLNKRKHRERNSDDSPESSYEWFKRRVLRSLYTKMYADDAIDIKRFFIIEQRFGKFNNRPGLIDPLLRFTPSIDGYLPLLRRVVVLAYSQIDLVRKLDKDESIKSFGPVKDFWFYHAPVSKNKIDKIRKFFHDNHFRVVDYTVQEIWEADKAARAPVTKRAPRPKLEGYASLLGVYSSGKETRIENCFLEDAPRVSNPTCYLKVQYSKAESNPLRLVGLRGDPCRAIITLVGGKCAVIKSDAQEKKLNEAGVVELQKHIVDLVCDRVSTSPEFLAYWPECLTRALLHKNGEIGDKIDSYSLSIQLFDMADVRKTMGLTTVLTASDLLVLTVWRQLATGYMTRNADSVQAAAKFIEGMPLSMAILEIAKKVQENDILKIMRESEVLKIIGNPAAKTNGSFDRLVKITQIALG